MNKEIEQVIRGDKKAIIQRHRELTQKIDDSFTRIRKFEEEKTKCVIDFKKLSTEHENLLEDFGLKDE